MRVECFPLAPTGDKSVQRQCARREQTQVIVALEQQNPLVGGHCSDPQTSIGKRLCTGEVLWHRRAYLRRVAVFDVVLVVGGLKKFEFTFAIFNEELAEEKLVRWKR